MPKRRLTYGDRALDQELDDLWKAATTAPTAAKQTVQETIVQQGLAPSIGVPSGTYGDATDVAQIIFNAQGQITGVSNVAILTLIPVVTSDPASPSTGQLWYRSDTNMLSIWTGSATKRVGMT